MITRQWKFPMTNILSLHLISKTGNANYQHKKTWAPRRWIFFAFYHSCTLRVSLCTLACSSGSLWSPLVSPTRIFALSISSCQNKFSHDICHFLIFLMHLFPLGIILGEGVNITAYKFPSFSWSSKWIYLFKFFTQLYFVVPFLILVPWVNTPKWLKGCFNK